MDYQKLTIPELQKLRKNTISFKVLADVENELKRRKKIKKTSLEKFQDLGLNVKTELKIREIITQEIKKCIQETSKEYIVWGIPPGKKDEDILFTKAKSYPQAKKICDILEKEHGCKKCRVQELDLSTEPDFKNVFNESKKLQESDHDANVLKRIEKNAEASDEDIEQFIKGKTPVGVAIDRGGPHGFDIKSPSYKFIWSPRHNAMWSLQKVVGGYNWVLYDKENIVKK